MAVTISALQLNCCLFTTVLTVSCAAAAAAAAAAYLHVSCSDASTFSSQLIRDLRADALLETNIPIPGSYDSCSCILSHMLGLPRVLANGCALFNGPSSVPQVTAAAAAVTAAVFIAK
jgi:hypothetical protein